MVSIDVNGRIHDKRGRFSSEKKLTRTEIRELATKYNTTPTNRVQRPNGQWATKKEADKVREVKLYLKAILDEIDKGRGGTPRIMKVPEGFEGKVIDGNFVSKKWALYYECTCKVKKESPKYNSPIKIEDDGEFTHIVKHWMAISTWNDNHSNSDAVDIHNNRWPNHELVNLRELEAKVKPELKWK